MSAHLRLARRVLTYNGISAAAAAAALGVDVDAVRNERRALGRDPELGLPDSGRRRSDVHESFEFYDSMMRCNRGVVGL